jgi:hypothetical protein
MADPIVVEGNRGPEARGLYRQEQGLPVETSLLAKLKPALEGEAVFVSPNQSFRITLWEDWSPEKITIGHGGVRQPDRREAQFRGGIYRTKDPREIQALRKATSHGVYFYERAKLEEMAREAKLNSALMAAEDPDVAAALRTKLGLQEMPLPPKESTVKPIK